MGRPGKPAPEPRSRRVVASGAEMPGGEEALAEVAADDLFGVADGGQVGAGVPLEQEIEIKGELGAERGRGCGEIRGEEVCDVDSERVGIGMLQYLKPAAQALFHVEQLAAVRDS